MHQIASCPWSALAQLRAYGARVHTFGIQNLSFPPLLLDNHIPAYQEESLQ